jgi:hypothetical protein
MKCLSVIREPRREGLGPLGLSSHEKKKKKEIIYGCWGSIVVKALRYWSDGPWIDPGGVTWDFLRGSFRQNHVP